MAFMVKDKEDAEQCFKKIRTSYNVSPDAEQFKSSVIKRINAEYIAGFFFGESMAGRFSDAYYAIVNDLVFFSSNKGHIKVLIEKYLNGATLNNNSDFINYAGTLDANSNIFVYIQPGKMKQFLKSNAKKQSENKLMDSYKTLQHFSPMSIEWSKPGKTLISSGYIGHNSKTPSQSTLVWNVQLQDTPAMPPQIVKNHLNGQEEIIIQDWSNILYLINNSGKILWKKELNKTILGDIKQLDYFGNGILYYLFNTTHHVYLLDRNGNEVHNFPKRLSNPANAGLSIHFNDNTDYPNFFVPCGNNQIYAYETSGKPLEGWSPRRGLGWLPYSMQHIQYKGKNYHFALNSMGNLYILDEYGDVLHKVILGSKPVAAPELDMRNGIPKIIVSTKNGQTHFINLQGKKWSKKYVSFVGNSDFETADVHTNKGSENLFLSRNKVYVFNDKKLLFEQSIPANITASDIFVNSLPKDNTYKTGVFCEDMQKIYLLDNNGEVYKGFPLNATTPFVITDLYGTKDNILVAGGTDKNVFTYRVK